MKPVIKISEVASKRLSGRAKKKRGFALIEVLVAALVFAFGVLGIVGLQARMSTAQSSASLRLTAINLSQEIIGAMWADVSPFALGRFTTANCDSDARCKSWKNKVERELPEGTPTIAVAGNVATIQITWNTKDGAQRYQTLTAVQP